MSESSPKDKAVAMTPQMLKPYVRRLNSKLGYISVGPKGMSHGWGTAAFVARGDRKFLLTAKHVTDRVFKMPGHVSLEFARDPDGPSIPYSFPLTKASVRWESAGLDVAVLDAPLGLQQLTSALWFDIDESRRILPRLRRDYEKVSAPFLLLAAGYARFTQKDGRLDSGQSVEVFGAATIPATIEALPPSADGTTIYVTLAFDEPNVPLGSDPTSPIAQIAAQAEQAVRENPAAQISDLKGMSGGPLVILTDAGEELIGTICFGPDDNPWTKTVNAALLDDIDPSSF